MKRIVPAGGRTGSISVSPHPSHKGRSDAAHVDDARYARPFSASQRSASIAALQPMPAAVIACR